MLLFILYKIGEFVTLALPVRISYKVAYLISGIKYFFSFREKREIVENLKAVLPGEDEKTLKKYSREISVNFSKYLVDFLMFKKLNLSYIKKHAPVIGRNYVDEALKKGKGVILLSAHIGSWELGGAVMGILGYPISVVALNHKNKFVNNFFIRQREVNNEKIISINFAIRKCLNALMNNELIAIVGDKNYVNHGVVVEFFGKDTLLPKGPAALSLKTGAAIIPAYLLRVKDENFELVFEKPIEYTPTGDFENDVKNLTEHCVKSLENCIRKFPTQWYCFGRFWIK